MDHTEADSGSPPTKKKIKIDTVSTVSATTTTSLEVNQQPPSSKTTAPAAAAISQGEPSPSGPSEVNTGTPSSSTPKLDGDKGQSAKSNGASKKGGAKTAIKFNGMRQQQASSSSMASKLGGGTMATSVVKKATKEVNAFKTVAEDPAARSTYKSLFNSGNEARPKEITSNWVTFFPYH